MSEPPDLIPLRALNQASYCERLYWLEYIDAIMPVNEYVEDGLFVHRRVDSPELAGKTRKDDDCLHTRSAMLSSERLGLIGKLDLIEEKGDAVYPVETKRSAAPRDESGRITFWENDAVQLAGQAMLLEESLGRVIPSGVLFYHGSRERVRVEFTPELRAKVLTIIDRIREMGTTAVPPAPLPHSLRHRCEGCSLVTVCLPEETLFQLEMTPNPSAQTEADESTAITRVIPQSHDGAVLYLQEQGSILGKRSEHLVIRAEGTERAKVPITQVRQVVIFGNVQVSTQALEALAMHEVPVMLLNRYGRFIAAVLPAPTKNVSLRTMQFEKFRDREFCLGLAKSIVVAKITNQRTLLMRWLRSRETDTARGSDDRAARGMLDLVPSVNTATNFESLLGLEGQAAALYFGEFGRFIKPSPPTHDFDFTTRNRRPPRDPVNALLSFAYSLLCKDCFSAACTVGFDPYAGFYHQGRYGKPSLALDLMEEFRGIIADSVVIGLINNRTLTGDDFLRTSLGCQLTESGRKKFFAAYEQRKSTVVKHPIYRYAMSYSRMIEVQARMLAAYVRGDVPTYTGFMVR